MFKLFRNYNSRSRNITFSSLDNESETETDPVYYEAESFYATPVGNTASDHSKSINENEASIYEMSQTMQLMNQIKPPDMSKAISEPIQIYLDCLISESVQSLQIHENPVDGHGNTQYLRADQKHCNIGKSFSDNTLNTDGLILNCGSGSKHHQNQLTNTVKTSNTNSIECQTNQLDQLKPKDHEDETSNCDASELLTPVNERNISDRYLLETETSDSLIHGHCDLNDVTKDLRIDTSTDQHELDKLHCNTIHSKSAPPLKTNNRRFSKQTLFPDGKYKGKAIHCDGNVFNIFYTISSQELPCGRKVFCVWICRDECDIDDEEEDDGKHPNLTLTFNSITSNIETSVDGLTGTAKRNSMNVNANQTSRPNSVSLLSQYEDDQVSGEYNKYYSSLKQIGKGAFGYVKLSFRHSDRLLVVTKFILKDKLPPQFMVITEDKKEIPMEVYLLSTLKHPNIVTVLDVFENEKFFQLVMEKHGSGMDLFEFIDRRPLMDEQLGKKKITYKIKQLILLIDYKESLSL